MNSTMLRINSDNQTIRTSDYRKHDDREEDSRANLECKISNAMDDILHTFQKTTKLFSHTETLALIRNLKIAFDGFDEEHLYESEREHGDFTVKMIGRKFGTLMVIRQSGTGRNGSYCYDCICDCGKSINVDGYKLRAGHRRSCGCMQGKGKVRKSR